MVDGTFPWLPHELLVKVLEEIPASKDGTETLIHCLQGSRSLRTAATTPSIWEPHVKAHYSLSAPEREKVRLAECAGNWYKVFATRRSLDRQALRYIIAIENTTESNHREIIARQLILELGIDVWDFLKSEASRPLPLFFDESETENREDINRITLTRRFWAKEILGVIARRYSISRWITLISSFPPGPPLPDCPLFEEALACLSGFWEVHPLEVVKFYDELAGACKSYLTQHEVIFDMDSPEFDAEKTCRAICDFMSNEGYKPVESGNFYDERNSFPHLYLHSLKKTLPISLVCIFVSIARRLGLPVSPLNVPVKVRALLHHTVVDVTDHQSPNGVHTFPDVPEITYSSRTAATTTRAMLLRSKGNILMALHQGRTVLSLEANHHREITESAAAYISALFDETGPIFRADMTVHPLDETLVFKDVVEPNIRAVLCRDIEAATDRISSVRKAITYDRPHRDRCSLPRKEFGENLKYFVGQIITNSVGQIGCILHWKPGGHEYSFMAETGLVPIYYVQMMSGVRLFLGNHEVLVFSGTTPQTLRSVFKAVPSLGYYFADAEWDSQSGHGRYIMNDAMKKVFPEDDEFGAEWVRSRGGYENRQWDAPDLF